MYYTCIIHVLNAILKNINMTLHISLWQVHGHEYTSQTSHELYQACGVASDW